MTPIITIQYEHWMARGWQMGVSEEKSFEDIAEDQEIPVFEFTL
jgi:hypothetical protein